MSDGINMEDIISQAIERFKKYNNTQSVYIYFNSLDAKYLSEYFNIDININKRTKGEIYGFPCAIKPWCNSKLKVDIVQNYLRKNVLPLQQSEGTNIRVPNDEGELVYGIKNGDYP